MEKEIRKKMAKAKHSREPIEAPESREVMNVEELAAYLNLGIRTVYSMAHDGEIPGVKLAGAWRFPKAAIDEWLITSARANLRGD